MPKSRKRTHDETQLDKGEEAGLDPHWRKRFLEYLAGRGLGKNRAGAEWVRMIAESNCEARIALISSSLTAARSVMVEGESGILECSHPSRRPVFEASLRRIRFPNGAQAHLYSAAEPEALRGPQFSHAFWAGAERVFPQPVNLNHRCDAGRNSSPDHWITASQPD